MWGAADDERAQDLFHQHRWFELRGVIVADQFADALIRGSLASAFNHPQEAEQQLKRAIRLAKGYEQSNAARDKLVALYLRDGRTVEAVVQLKAILKRDPSPRPDTQNVLDLFGPLAAAGDFSAHLPKGGVTLPCEVHPDGVWLSLAVNGKKVTWLLDTGFNFSGVSESEAHALGISIHDGGASVHDDAGGQARTKSGIVDKIVVGGIEFRKVPVLIYPDAQEPWRSWAQGRRGIAGLPLALAMQTISWTRDGTCQAGLQAAVGGTSNLAFDDFNPVVQGVVDGRPIDLLLDTGNQAGTQLWTRFQVDFPEILNGAGVTAGMEQVTQAGGSNARATANILEFHFEVGGFKALLKPGKLFGKPVGNDYQHGLLGMDVFSQAREVVIDFRTMTLVLR